MFVIDFADSDYLFARDKVERLSKSLEDFWRLEENDLFLVNPSSNATLFFVSRIFDQYLDACRYLMKILPSALESRGSILNYLTLKTTYSQFVDSSDNLRTLMSMALDGAEDNDLKFVSDGNLEFIQRLNVANGSGGPIPLDEMVQVPVVIETTINSYINQTIELFERIQRRMKHPMSFMQGNELKDYVISKFRQFVDQRTDDYLFKLRASAIKLKNDRLVRLSKQHWADLAELDEQLMGRIIDGLSVDVQDYACLYDDNEWEMLVKNRDILKILRDTTDPENLYDWSMLFNREYLFDRYVNASNVMFLFSRVHRANLIKCELYNGNRMRYDLFLFGKITSGKSDGFDSPVIDADSIPEDEESTQSTPQQNASSSPATRQTASPFIHPRIDEEKLVNFTKDFTDGPNRASCFNKNCLWLSVYIVFCQKHPKLGNRSILLSKSRAKFEEWVQSRISPSVYRCFKRSLDTAPPYFRKMQNYPWSLAAYLKAKGQKESTFNSYAQVAEYFQKCVFDNIEDFMID